MICFLVRKIFPHRRDCIGPKSNDFMPEKRLGRASKWNVNCPDGNFVDFDGMSERKGSVLVIGTGNSIVFQSGSKFNGSIEIRGKNNSVIIGESCTVKGKIVVKGNNQLVEIGAYSTFQSVYFLCSESCDIRIGRWCMFSRDVEVRTTDAHSVVDVHTGLRINIPASVVVGDHVWVGVGVLISKGTVIAEDSIIGAHSFVNTSFLESQTVIAGIPAKVVTHGVTWHRSRKPQFSSSELNVWRGPGYKSDTSLAEE